MNGNPPPMGSMPPSTPPITTPPLRTMPPAPPVQSSSPFRVVFLLAVVVVLVGIVVWFWSFQSAPQPQQTTATFLLHTADGTSWWYQLSGSTIRPLAPQTATSTGGEVTIVESSQGLPVGTPVLATHAQLPGERFGLLSQNGRFTSLTLPGTERRGLTVRPDGLAAFAYLTDSQSASALSAWHVGVLDTSRAGISVFTDLGMGYAPSFATNGNILALAPEGFVEINAATGVHTTLLSAKTDFPLTFAVGPGGSFVVMKNDVTNASDVFWVNSAKPSDISYIGSVTPPPVALGIIDSTSFVAQTSATAGTLYSVSPSGITGTKTVTFTR